VHFVPCLGPVDAVLRIDVDKRNAWRGNQADGRIFIDKPELFGGKKREGGVSGYIDLANGLPTQGRNDYLQSQLGAEIPAFRGVLSAILRQTYIGNNPYLKPWAFKVQRVFTGADGGEQWLPEIAGISRGIEVDNAAIYIALDVSPSMAGEKMANAKAAIAGFLDAVKVASENAPDRNDVRIQTWDANPVAMITRRNCRSQDYDDLISFITALPDTPTGGGTNFAAAVQNAADFFIGTSPNDPLAAFLTGGIGELLVNRDQPQGSGIKRRVVLFITDGEPFPEESAAAGAATLFSIANVESYAFNIDLTNISFTQLMDNTPIDGVPVVSGGDPQALLNALSAAFPLGFDMNPAHILREVLTARDTGGTGDTDIIGASFATAAQALYDEGFGLSFFWSNTNDRESFKRVIEQHIDARVYVDRRTGLWEIKLIRNDFEENTLPEFNDSNVTDWQDIEWPDPSELPNAITVVYTDPQKDEPASITRANPARVRLAGALITEKREYEGIYSAAIASRVCERDLASASAPLVRGTFRARYVDPAINIGSPIKLNSARKGLVDVVARVVEITDGDGRDNGVTVRFIQDQFALPNEAFVEVEVINRPRIGEALPSDPRLVEEAPYYELVRQASQTDADQILAAEPDAGFLAMTGAPPSQAAISAEAWIDAGLGYALGAVVDFSPTVVLRSTLPQRADRTKILVDYDISLATIAPGSLAIIGGEYVRVDSIDLTGPYEPGDYWAPPVAPPGAVALVEVGRGVLDTAPLPHVVGENVIFWGEFSGSNEIQYLATETVDVKLRTFTGSDLLALDSAPTDSVTFDSRAIRPLPPGKLQSDGNYFGSVWEGEVTLTWAHRDRTLQTTAVIDDHTEGDIGPEVGTEYSIRAAALDTDDTVLEELLLLTGLTGTTETINEIDFTTPLPSEWAKIRFEVYSVRDGYESWTRPYLDFTFPTSYILNASSDELDPPSIELLAGDEEPGGSIQAGT
jgi:hypothetical protein